MGDTLRRIKDKLPLILFILGALVLVVLGLTLVSCVVQIIGLKTELNKLKDEVHGLEESQKQSGETRSTGGSTYYRWGRSSCQSVSTLIYEGFAAGGHYYYNGSAANTLCLPRDPILKDKQVSQSVTRIYGTEYENPPIKNHDVPCAVCNTMTRTNLIMIPARNACPDSWTVEYKGMLMAGYYTQNGATEYICVDETPETVGATNANQNGKLLYLVATFCGSLPCAVYPTGKLIPCVVCSR